MSPRALWEASKPKFSDKFAASVMSVGLSPMHIAENSSNLLMDWKSPKMSLKSRKWKVRKTISGKLGVSQNVPASSLRTFRVILRQSRHSWDCFSQLSFSTFRTHFGDFQSISLFSLSCFQLYTWTWGPPASPMKRNYRSILSQKLLRESAGTFWGSLNIPETVFRNFNFRLFGQFFKIFRVSVKFIQEFPDVVSFLAILKKSIVLIWL